MGITDWNAWMKEHHIYIPTNEEIEKAMKENQRKVHAMEKMYESLGSQLQKYKETVDGGSH